MQVPKRKSEEGRQRGPDDNYLSQAAIDDLEAQLARLERNRPKAVEDLTRAREMGDLSENAAYTEAKARLRGMDTRMSVIKSRLKHAVLIPSGPSEDGKVRLGATVTIRREDGTTKTYAIVGAQETEPGSGRISLHSPLGTQLMGKGVGDTATLPSGVTVTITEVK